MTDHEPNANLKPWPVWTDLVCARVLHDLVGPVGAINNGLELLEFYRKAVEVVKRCDPDYDISSMEAVLVYLDEAWSEFSDELK